METLLNCRSSKSVADNNNSSDRRRSLKLRFLHSNWGAYSTCPWCHCLTYNEQPLLSVHLCPLLAVRRSTLLLCAHYLIAAFFNTHGLQSSPDFCKGAIPNLLLYRFTQMTTPSSDYASTYLYLGFHFATIITPSWQPHQISRSHCFRPRTIAVWWICSTMTWASRATPGPFQLIIN